MESSAKRFTAFRLNFRRAAKFIVCICICIGLIFGYSYNEPVHVEAAATAATVAGVVLVAAAASALGIGVSAAMNNESYTQACANVWNRMSSSVQQAAQPIKLVGNYLQCQFSKAFLQSTLDGLRTEYPQQGISSVDMLAQNLGWSDYVRDDVKKYANLDAYDNFNLLQQFNVSGSNISFPFGKLCFYIKGTMPDGVKLYDASLIGTNTFDRLGYSRVFSTSILSLFYCHIIDGGYTYFIFCNNSSWYAGVHADSSAAIPIPDVYIPALESLFAQGYSVMNHSLQDVIDRIGALQGEVDGIRVALPDAVGTLTSINDLIKSLTQQDVTQTDATDTAEKEANKTVNQNRDTTVPKNPTMPDLALPSGLQKKFPFCLPWDLAAIYKLFQVTPKAPTWTVPVNIDVGSISLHKNYTYDLNSNGVLDKGLGVFKWFLNISFVVALILLFKKIVS